jgi:protein-S-isoprenylcysteine O-methyltransferase Ste14
MMVAPDLLVAGLLALCVLSPQSITYSLAMLRPRALETPLTRLSGNSSDPVEGLRRLFLAFKAVQVVAVLGWTVWFGDLLAGPTASLPVVLAGAALFLAGQGLVFAGWRRLGTEGVLYGAHFGRDIPWVRGFPFSWVRHPLYVGAWMTVWGALLVLRYPNPDWVVIPLIETCNYLLVLVVEELPASRPTAAVEAAASSEV